MRDLICMPCGAEYQYECRCGNANLLTFKEIQKAFNEDLSEEEKKKQLINQMLDGEIDIYQIHTAPEGELQKQLSKEIDTLYNEAAQDGHHLDDDVEAIYKSILNKYEKRI